MLTWVMVIEFYKSIHLLMVESFETKLQKVNMQDEQR